MFSCEFHEILKTPFLQDIIESKDPGPATRDPVQKGTWVNSSGMNAMFHSPYNFQLSVTFSTHDK